jgi:hypothetical protein
MIVASWLIAVDPGKAKEARAALTASAGRQIKDKQGSRWIVLLTESPQQLAATRQELLKTPGVEAADPIASFDDEDSARELVRWSAAS